MGVTAGLQQAERGELQLDEGREVHEVRVRLAWALPHLPRGCVAIENRYEARKGPAAAYPVDSTVVDLRSSTMLTLDIRPAGEPESILPGGVCGGGTGWSSRPFETISAEVSRLGDGLRPRRS